MLLRPDISYTSRSTDLTENLSDSTLEKSSLYGALDICKLFSVSSKLNYNRIKFRTNVTDF